VEFYIHIFFRNVKYRFSLGFGEKKIPILTGILGFSANRFVSSFAQILRTLFNSWVA
jgi:hypothetical protein